MRYLGFRYTLILSVIGLTFGCLFISNWLSYVDIRDSVTQRVSQNSQNILNYEANKIESWFEDKARAVDILANRYQSQERVRQDDFVDIARLTKDSTDLTNVFIGMNDGRAFSSQVNEMWVDGIADPAQYDPRQRGWFQSAKHTPDRLGVTDVYEDAGTKELVVSIYKNAGELVALADISLDILTDTVNSVNFPGAVTVIVDQSGKAIASDSPALKPGVRLSDIGLSHVYQAMMASRSAELSYQLKGVEKLIYTREITLTPDRKWYLVIGIDKAVAYKEVSQMLKDVVVTSVIMLVIMTILVLVTLNYLYRPVLALKSMTGDLAKGNGDLTQRLPVISNDDLGQISNDVNTFISNLQAMMLEISQSSEHISGSIAQLEQRVKENTRILDAHHEETELIVTAIEEMSATANDVARNTAQAAQATTDTNQQSVESKDTASLATTRVCQLAEEVSQTASSISVIDKDMTEITTVLQVIGEIADQTNLLALNAAIEAARAGEQGRGFAVVADEVRSLAARTQESTGEIENTLLRLRKATEQAKQAMDMTGQSCERTVDSIAQVTEDLDKIRDSVGHVNDLNTQVATAAEEQSSVTDEITRNMASIKEMVTVLAGNAQQTNQETLNLSTTNTQLKAFVQQFKLS